MLQPTRALQLLLRQCRHGGDIDSCISPCSAQAGELHSCLSPSSRKGVLLSFPALQGESALSPFLLSRIPRTASFAPVPAWSLGGAVSHYAQGWLCRLMPCHGCTCLLLPSPPCRIRPDLPPCQSVNSNPQVPLHCTVLQSYWSLLWLCDGSRSGT